jgi:O-antigen/teichoic acid export membrane protein
LSTSDRRGARDSARREPSAREPPDATAPQATRHNLPGASAPSTSATPAPSAPATPAPATSPTPAPSTPATPARSYGSGARVLSVGIAATGLLTFAFFSIASHVLSADAAERVDVLWSVMFVVISVIYRPVEQLLSRTIAERRAVGHTEHPLRVPIAIQAGFALIFLILALAFREELLNEVFDHYAALYDVLVVGTLAYAGSYFARGWLAGNEYFALYGGLVLMEASSRICFALAVALGIASGQTAIALGIAAAPLLSLVVVPAAFARRGHERHDAALAEGSPGTGAAVRLAPRGLRGPERDQPALDQRAGEPAPFTVDEADAALAGPGTEGVQENAAHGELSLRRGGRFALWVSAIMLSEQTLLNAAVLTVYATSDQALAGIVFNVMLIARAPLQLFQAIQTSLLPHLTGLEAREGHAAFGRAIRLTVRAIAAFAGAVGLGLLLIGPFVMGHVLFGQHYSYGRVGLALIGLGMGMHLTAGALNQAALARNRARAAASCWLAAAGVFVVWMLLPLVGEQVLRAEIGYFGAASLLAALLALLYRRGARRPAATSQR